MFSSSGREKSVPDLSVVICTYNGALHLPKLLKALRSQQAPCRWELVVVDNNSSDRTAPLIQSLQPHWPTEVPPRYCFEPMQGIAFSRRRAVQETQSPLIGFLDDDTLPEADWVSEVFYFAHQHPEVGAYDSSIRGLYEVSPPLGFHRIACCLAIIDRGEKLFQYTLQQGVLPAGAGMVVRRQAWLEQVPVVPALSGVKAGSLAAKGEDVETLSYIRQAWPIWHNPAMKLGHIIPKERLKRSYLKTLFWQIGLSRYPLRKLRYQRWQWPLFGVLYFVSDLRKGLVYLLRSFCFLGDLGDLGKSPKELYGTVEICEISLLLGSLLSPFFCCWNRRHSSRHFLTGHLSSIGSAIFPIDFFNYSAAKISTKIGQH